MFSSIWDDVKRQFNYGNMVTRIVLINIAAFVIINLILVFSGGGHLADVKETISKYFSLNRDLWFDLTHPWVIVTHMFSHIGFGHILWNMLLVYWFGRIVGDLIGDHRILPLYLLGGLTGGIAYLIFAQYAYPDGAYAYGASAAMMAVVVASGVLAPDYLFNLILIGEVKLKFIVATLVFLDIIGVGSDINTGGHVAHLGGAFFGWLFVTQLRNGNDLSVPVNNFLDGLIGVFRSKPKNTSTRRKPKMVYKNPNQPAKNRKAASKPHSVSDEVRSTHQAQLDAILDKIKKSGYESLSAEEKEFLFNASKK